MPSTWRLTPTTIQMMPTPLRGLFSPNPGMCSIAFGRGDIRNLGRATRQVTSVGAQPRCNLRSIQTPARCSSGWISSFAHSSLSSCCSGFSRSNPNTSASRTYVMGSVSSRTLEHEDWPHQSRRNILVQAECHVPCIHHLRSCKRSWDHRRHCPFACQDNFLSVTS